MKLSGTALEHLYDVSGTCWYVLGPGLGTSLVRAGARNGSLRLQVNKSDYVKTNKYLLLYDTQTKLAKPSVRTYGHIGHINIIIM